MEILGIPAVFILFLLLLIRPFTVFLHEMGHAVTGRLITGKRGSYGDKDKSFKINLKIYL